MNGAGKLVVVVGFTVVRGKIMQIDVLADPERLHRLEPAILRGRGRVPTTG